MSPPVLSAFDPGTRLFGWCVGDGSRLPECGAWAIPHSGDSLGVMLAEIDDRLTEHLDRYEPSHVAYEAPILVVNAKYRDKSGQIRTRTDDLGKLRKLYNLGGHIEFVCERRRIPCVETSLFAMKRELAGVSHAEKADMVFVAKKVGMELPAGPGAEDAADAFASWLLLLRSKSPALSARFDSAIWGARGALI